MQPQERKARQTARDQFQRKQEQKLHPWETKRLFSKQERKALRLELRLRHKHQQELKLRFKHKLLEHSLRHNRKDQVAANLEETLEEEEEVNLRNLNTKKDAKSVLFLCFWSFS